MDIRNVLGQPIVYELFQAVVGATRMKAYYVSRFGRPKKGESGLDIGCGRGNILQCMPDGDYTRIDVDRSYIEMAQKRHGKRGTFLCRSAASDSDFSGKKFDLILA